MHRLVPDGKIGVSSLVLIQNPVPMFHTALHGILKTGNVCHPGSSKALGIRPSLALGPTG